jgi:hypothetical protein
LDSLKALTWIIIGLVISCVALDLDWFLRKGKVKFMFVITGADV